MGFHLYIKYLFYSSMFCVVLVLPNETFGQQDVTDVSEGTDIERGATLLGSYGCAGCHKIPGIYGMPGNIAQPLDHWSERNFIAGRFPNTREKLIEWIQFPQKVKQNTAMPNLNITLDEAKDMAAYLYEH